MEVVTIFQVFKYDGQPYLEGKNPVSAYHNWAEIETVQWGRVNNSSFAKGVSGPDHPVTECEVTLYPQSGSALALQQATASGTVFPKIALKMFRVEGMKYSLFASFDLFTTVFTTYHLSGTGDGNIPIYSVGIHFQRMDRFYYGVTTSS